MILGHLAIATIAKRKFLPENFIFLVTASYGPDLIDKTLNLAFDTPSRGVGHTLLMWVLITAAVWFFGQWLRINKQILCVGAILWLSHLITDLLELEVLFWPFLGPFPVPPYYTFMGRLWNYYVIHKYPGQLIIEILSITIAMILWISYSLRRRLRSPA